MADADRVNPRVLKTLQAAFRLRHRSIFFIVGDQRAALQVVRLHAILAHVSMTASPSVTWCYQENLLCSPKQLMMGPKAKKLRSASFTRGGEADTKRDKDDNAEIDTWRRKTAINFCYYRESDRILGTTCDMLVLQDFDALTPNMYARTIDTVAGGGLIAIVISKLSSLRQISDAFADSSAAASTSAPRSVFNARLLSALTQCPSFVPLDDTLAVLEAIAPSSQKAITQWAASAPPVPPSGDPALQAALGALRTHPLEPLLRMAATADQAGVIVELLDTLMRGKGTVFVQAGRGRGKSAALGLAVAAAVRFGCARVCVAAPAASNVGTLFDFAQRGLVALGYAATASVAAVRLEVDAADGDAPTAAPAAGPRAPQSSFMAGGRFDASVGAGGLAKALEKKTTVRRGTFAPVTDGANVVALHVAGVATSRVTFVVPTTTAGGTTCVKALAHAATADVVLVDEAAALPLPTVRALTSAGAPVAFLASTVSGYEGTGRALTTKFVAELRREADAAARGDAVGAASGSSGADGGSGALLAGGALAEVSMSAPVRYGVGCPVELWLQRALCLAPPPSRALRALPPPEATELYAVNRAALFALNDGCEAFLNSLVGHLAASHYKNQPDDLLVMADAPRHHVFVLLPANRAGVEATLRDIVKSSGAAGAAAAAGGLDCLAVLHVAEEGGSDARVRGAGDLVPSVLQQHYSVPQVAAMRGLRVVRIATHAACQRAGYGRRALQLLEQYVSDVPKGAAATAEAAPSLLAPVAAAGNHPGRVDYLSAAFGATPALHAFWGKCGYRCVHVRPRVSDITGEHSCIVVKPVRSSAAPSADWAVPAGSAAASSGAHAPLWPRCPTTAAGGAGDVSCEALPRAARWSAALHGAFLGRLVRLLNGPLRSISVGLSLPLIAPAVVGGTVYGDLPAPANVLRVWDEFVSVRDEQRLRAFARGGDFVEVADVMVPLATLYFSGKLCAAGVGTVGVPPEASVLLAVGLQGRNIDDLAAHDSFLQVGRREAITRLSVVVRRVMRHVDALRDSVGDGAESARADNDPLRNVDWPSCVGSVASIASATPVEEADEEGDNNDDAVAEEPSATPDRKTPTKRPLSSKPANRGGSRPAKGRGGK